MNPSGSPLPLFNADFVLGNAGSRYLKLFLQFVDVFSHLSATSKLPPFTPAMSSHQGRIPEAFGILNQTNFGSNDIRRASNDNRAVVIHRDPLLVQRIESILGANANATLARTDARLQTPRIRGVVPNAEFQVHVKTHVLATLTRGQPGSSRQSRRF